MVEILLERQWAWSGGPKAGKLIKFEVLAAERQRGTVNASFQWLS